MTATVVRRAADGAGVRSTARFKERRTEALCNKSGARPAAKRQTSPEGTSVGYLVLTAAGLIKIALTESGIFTIGRDVFGRRRVTTAISNGDSR